MRILLSRHRIAVALWLALLLPCGLTAAAAHLLLHMGASSGSPLGDSRGDAALDNAHCDLCLAAAAASTPAPPPQWPALAHPTVRALAPPDAQSADVDSAMRLAYRSRAPPASPL
jgi:hypothetical protein